jgi:IS30 family transposase
MTLKEFQAIYNIQKWFRWYKFYKKHRDLFEKILGLPANHNSVLGRMFPNGGDLYKETYKSLQNLLISF